MSVTTRWIDIDAGGGEHYDGYLALPRAGKGPGVIIVQEIFGVNAHIRSVAEQYALAGYVALAPDIFWRSERRVELGYEGADRDKALALLKQVDADQTAADLGAAAKVLRALPETSGKIGAVGFCFGGQLTYLMAARGSVDAAVAYYGGGIQNKLDEADKVRVPMLFHYAEHDSSIPQAAVAQVRQRFASHANAAFYDYAGVGHGFNCSDRSAYDQHASALAHGRTLEFLSSNL
ncbi:carboxymethylenebutenolidase [Trinickia dabaoshanensis]|uniref:Carboxymethylenebutenolidase n=1 Tax=Trinickia dabaoshanensis TaxID=564714 RepID=A0A2N7VZ75_9BURK|nr:dienelactone hydrolase family protein [Trinickia dabaoshanensis]PMS22454.1 carboxymethylenebutenolidase [Trinickia dabaoshanensis]